MSTKASKASETVKQDVAILTLEQYVQRNKVNPGTVASFKYEAKKAGDDLKPRTKDEWTSAIEAQKNRVY